jgi:transcriptional regulator with XRE-family HTH domain
MSLGLKIRQIRNAKGIKQEELASCLGVSQGTLSKMENDTSPILALDLKKIADYLQVPFNEFLLLRQHDIGSINSDIVTPAKEHAYVGKISLLEKRIFDLEEWIKDLRTHNSQLREALLASNQKIEIIEERRLV